MKRVLFLDSMAVNWLHTPSNWYNGATWTEPSFTYPFISYSDTCGMRRALNAPKLFISLYTHRNVFAFTYLNNPSEEENLETQTSSCDWSDTCILSTYACNSSWESFISREKCNLKSYSQMFMAGPDRCANSRITAWKQPSHSLVFW